MTTRIYVDTEDVFDGMSVDSGRPTEQDFREIVQIAAIRVDLHTGEELEAFDQLVHPAFVLPVPAFFTELTGISAEHITCEGGQFATVLGEFQRFCTGADAIWTFNADWSVFRQNCRRHNVVFPFATAPFIRVCSLLGSWGVTGSYSSGTLHRAAGVHMSGHVHNALFDVRSMAAAVHHFERQHSS